MTEEIADDSVVLNDSSRFITVYIDTVYAMLAPIHPKPMIILQKSLTFHSFGPPPVHTAPWLFRYVNIVSYITHNIKTLEKILLIVDIVALLRAHGEPELEPQNTALRSSGSQPRNRFHPHRNHSNLRIAPCIDVVALRKK